MERYTFLYRANVFAGIVDNQSTYVDECGILYAHNFTEAVKQLEDYYGTDMESFEMSVFDTSMLRFPAEHYNETQAYLGKMA